MDPQFQELAAEIAKAVEDRLSGAFEGRIKSHIDTVEERIATNVEQRLSGAFEGRLKTHVDSFEERVKTHIDTVEERIATNVEKRLSGAFEERIKTHVDTFEQRLTTQIDSKLSGVEGRLTTHVDQQLNAAVKELKHQAQLHKEDLREDVKKAAEGYDATLKKIDRELGELNQKFDTKFGDHDRVLANHNERLVKLEGQR